MISEIKFGPWLPEVTDYKNPGLEECQNAIPSPSGYQPAYGLTGTGDTVSGTVIGAKGFERADGTSVVCIATTSDLYTIVSSTSTAGSLTLSLSVLTDQVTFEQFGAEIYASTKNGDTWVLGDIESDLTFAAAGGSPPNGNALARVADFLVMGDLNDGTDYPYRIQWSKFNNPGGTWDTDIATQSGSQDLPKQHGPVTAISGGTFGMVFQKNGISRMTFNGRPSVFDLDLYEKNRGCVAPLSVLRRGDIAYYLSSDGFFSTDGASVVPISQGRIWEWFLDNANDTYLSFVSGGINYARRCCVWAFASESAQDYTEMLWYNWETENWGHVTQSVDALVVSKQAGTTLEQVAVLYPNLDTMPISLDSPTFQASGRNLNAIVGGELSEFTGQSLAAQFVTGSFQPEAGKRTFISAVTPLVVNDLAGTTTAIGSRELMTEAYITSPSMVVGPLGFSPHNVDGRYFRVITDIPASEEWSDAFGLQIDHARSGIS